MTRIVVEKNVPAAMRDGTVLRADVYRPDDGQHPVLLQRTPYNKELLALTAMTLDPIRAAAAGYAVVIQDVRARWASDGEVFFLYRDEREDGADSVEWAAKQDWSSGAVGSYGVSYMGGTSWLAAASEPPALRAISPSTAPNDFWRDHLWRGGALNWGLFVMWALQAIGPATLLRAKKSQADLIPALLKLIDDIDAFDDWVQHMPLKTFPPARPDDAQFEPFFFETLRHPTPDPWTDQMMMTGRHGSVRVPALIVAGWHDVMLDGDLAHFTSMRAGAGSAVARQATRIVIGPWSHGMFQNVVGELDFGLRASGLFLDLREDLTNLQLRWFDRWLKGKVNGIDHEAPVRLFLQGVNRWRDEAAWPLTRAEPRALYLNGERSLDWALPAVDLPPDTYVYDPGCPCPTCGGAILLPPTYPRGPVNQAPILGRSDVLSYTGAPLERDLEVTGPVSAVLYAATSGRDTDWVIKLCDVHPDGRTINVCDGVLRARYRRSFTAPELPEPDRVLRYEIRMSSTAMVFKAGHRLRVVVTSSDFPRYDRNPNTGEHPVEATRAIPARQQIFHDANRASHLILPVIPA